MTSRSRAWIGFVHRRVRALRLKAGRLKSVLIGTVLGTAVPAYWWSYRANFGDLLTPLLLRHYGFTPILSAPEGARVVVVGSVLEQLPETYAGIILGAGFIDGSSRRSFPHAHILALRGELTRRSLGAGAGVALGDPGLLIGRLTRRAAPKSHVLGIVPHYADRHDPRLRQLCAANRGHVRLIDVGRDPLRVIRDIGRCEHIVASSLHAVVCADALGILNAWVILGDNVAGAGFKFRDYYSALRLDKPPLLIRGDEPLSRLIAQTSRAPGALVDQIAARLDAAFLNARQILGLGRCEPASLSDSC
jgi:pyruvyltransferase